MATSRTPQQSSMLHRNPEMVFSLHALALAALIGFAIWCWIGLGLYWVWLVAVNRVSFCLFRYDKRRARVAGATRVLEVVLLGLMWVGAGLGMYMRSRHKTKQVRFVISLGPASIVPVALLIR